MNNFLQTKEENNDEDSDEPVGEDDTESNTQGDAKHEHGLKEKGQIIVYNWHFFCWMRHSQIVPH